MGKGKPGPEGDGGKLGEAWLDLSFTKFVPAATRSLNWRGKAGGGETRGKFGVLSSHQKRMADR